MSEMRICEYCGNTFIPAIKNNRQRFCKESCRIEQKKIVARWRRKVNKGKVAEPKKKSISKSISEINKLARASGMDYGTYVALEQAKKFKVVRKW